MRLYWIAIAFSVALAPLAALWANSSKTPIAVTRAVSDTSRPQAQIASDADRKPAETLAFAGVKPGMIVGEFFPGGGYFTRLLSKVVGPNGHVYGIENVGWKGGVEAGRAMLAERKLENVSIAALPFGTVAFARPLDLVWITQNYHDLKIAEYGQVDIATFNRAVFAALKPGGTYLVLDHDAPAGTDPATIAKLHRIEKAQVIREVTAAGFKLEREGTFLRRAEDNRSLPVFDKRVQGRTDQYVLKFVKLRSRS